MSFGESGWNMVKKPIHCEHCNSDYHYSSFCPTIRKPIKRAVLKGFGKGLDGTIVNVICVPKTKPKKSDRAKAKKDCWTAFSIYIRTRDCLRFTGDPTQGKCVTCNRPYPITQLQAGHFISGRGNAVLLDERLVYSQCIGCNGNPPYGKGGNYVEYFRFMLDEVGLEKIDEFRALKNTTQVYKAHNFIELKEGFEMKTKVLIDEYKDKLL